MIFETDSQLTVLCMEAILTPVSENIQPEMAVLEEDVKKGNDKFQEEKILTRQQSSWLKICPVCRLYAIR